MLGLRKWESGVVEWERCEEEEVRMGEKEEGVGGCRRREEGRVVRGRRRW